MPIDLALSPDSQWDVDPADLVAVAARAGFVGLGVGVDRVGPAVLAAYEASALRCHEMLALIMSDDADVTVAAARRLAVAADAVQAPWVLAIYLPPATRVDGPVVERCAAILTEAGAGLAIEFTPIGPVASLRDGLAVVQMAGRERAGVILDSWHFCHGSNTWDELATVPLESVAYVQFADALAPASADLMHENVHRRALPGDGVLPLDRFATTLLERGWQGVVSAEVLNDSLRAGAVDDAVRRIHAATAPYWAA